MIVIFHHLLQYLFTYIKGLGERRDHELEGSPCVHSSISAPTDSSSSETTDETSTSFEITEISSSSEPTEENPRNEYVLKSLPAPVYKLRYQVVEQLLEKYVPKYSLKKMCEFGCAELKFLQYLLANYIVSLEEILAFDIDEEILRESKRRSEPTLMHHFERRQQPLRIKLCVASMAKPHLELQNVDVVVAIEVIEHLYPHVLEAATYNIFNFIKPKIIILTTPNADFNILFKKFKKMRHPDHKFEWTRSEFEDWARNITQRFPEYDVRFDGIGCVKGKEPYGGVTQMAVFERNIPKKCAVDADESFGICTHCCIIPDIDSYKVVHEVDFPHITHEHRLLDKLAVYIQHYRQPASVYYNDELGRMELPLCDLVKTVNCIKDDLHTDEEEAEKILKDASYQFEDIFIDGISLPCVIYQVRTPSNSSDEEEDGDNTAFNNTGDSELLLEEEW